MVNSNIEPQNIFADFATLRNGKLTIYVHWNITSEMKDDGMGNEYMTWYYDEAILPWILPQPYTSQEDIQNYLDANYDQGENILNWAKATKLNVSVM